jgi:hypothetical protein
MRFMCTVVNVFAVAAVLAFAPPTSATGVEFPDVVQLPDGFQPEGIARQGLFLYVGSLLDGDVYRASIATGAGARFVNAPPGRTAVGLTTDDRDHLFVAGGPLGTAYVYDAQTGAPLTDYQLGPAGTAFVNDVTVAPDAVYFTDSFQPVLYRLPLGHQGSLPSPADIETVVLTGPAADDHTPGQFNINGIASTLGGRALLVVNSFNGGLYSVDADTGISERIDLGAENLLNGDGLVLRGRQLLVVQNTQNKIAVVRLEDDLTSGRVVGEITDDLFRLPTTAADFGPFLYAVNARFDVAPPPFGGTPPSDPSLAYEVVRVLVPVIPR